MSGPRNAQDRLRGLLVMLPWLMEVGEVALSDVARRFAMSEAQVQKDLELVAMCGLPPFVDEMIDVFVDDGIVFVGVPRLFTRPLRLTAPEGFTLLSAARAAMELPGADAGGPLGRGLDKLARALADAGLDDTAGVVVDLARPALTDDLADAAANGRQLAVRYYSPTRDEVADRRIVPRHVFAETGNWYVLADDDRSGERRTFRIDRIEEAVPTGVEVPVDDVAGPPDAFFVDSDVPRATVRLGPDAVWVLEQYPVDEVAEIGDRPGWVEATMPVSGDRWLAKLLLRLGPSAEMVDPSAARPATEMATTMLARYGDR